MTQDAEKKLNTLKPNIKDLHIFLITSKLSINALKQKRLNKFKFNNSKEPMKELISM